MLVPFSTETLMKAGLLLFGLGGIGVLAFFGRAVSKSRRRRQGEKVKRRGCFTGLFELVFLLLITATGLLSLTIASVQKTYQAFTERQPVLWVHAFYEDAGAKKMTVRLAWPQPENAPRIETFSIVGDQWAVDSNILTWDDFLTVYNFRPGYKITRLRGRFLDTVEAKKASPSIVELSDESGDATWQWLLRHAARLPLIRASFGQSAYNYPDKDKIFEIQVSHDGLSVVELKGKQARKLREAGL